MSDTSFYARAGAAEGLGAERYDSRTATAGPWDPRLQHGGPVAALFGTRVERMLPEGMRVAHLALEFLSPVPVAPLDLTTDLVRPGKKIALYSSRGAVNGKEVARVTAWAVTTKEGRSPKVRFDEPVPPMPMVAESTYFSAVPKFPYGDALEWRFAEGGFRELGPAAVWSKLRVSIVDGEEVSPLARVLAMVDSANGISAELDVGKYLFVPVNLTVSLARLPTSEWVGMRAETAIATEGVGITKARIFDEQGTIGEAIQTLFVEAR